MHALTSSPTRPKPNTETMRCQLAGILYQTMSCDVVIFLNLIGGRTHEENLGESVRDRWFHRHVGRHTELGGGAPPNNDESDALGNTASGTGALQNNTTGAANTADGAFALFANTTGGSNTASGAEALFSNISGFFNTASGAEALRGNTTGFANTASGAGALENNTTGSGNTASGLTLQRHLQNML